MTYIFLFFLFVNSILLGSNTRVLTKPTFELLSGKYDEKHDRWKSFNENDRLDLEVFAENYNEKIGLLQFDAPRVLRIPRVINFIWVGPRPFPAESVANVVSWREFHPDWRICFWTDRYDRELPIADMEFHHINEISFIRLKPYLTQTTNYGEMADLIRYELIYQRGGMYVDHDVECLGSFDKFHSVFDFYASLENPHVNCGTKTQIYPCNCLFAARPHHPILKEAIRQVDFRWEPIGALYPGLDATSTFRRVINRTFHAFTEATKMMLNNGGTVDMVFPASYFFGHKIFHKKTLKKLLARGFVYAIHDFAYSWKGESESGESKSSITKKKRSTSF